MNTPAAILKKYWGYDQFRPLQAEIIESILAGKDTLAILPTGGGKSICFQVPALAMEGLCLVVSPLIALMKDQVENLKKRGVPALLIHTGMSRKDVVRILQNATNDYFKFLYLSPERLETSLFTEYLPALNVNMVAVDEAHCVSQWGYDFRPSYLRISKLREELPGVPFMALTASATPLVQQDICEKLELKQPQLFRQSFERKNLSYSVFKPQSKLARLVEILKKVNGTGIVYCSSRRRTVEIMQLLQLHGIRADHYHAGLDQQSRTAKQKSWIDDQTRVIVCTNAFGMGIDKAEVRIVIHADLPDCLENYYQEAGRAGRDGLKSYAVLLYDENDLTALELMHQIRFPEVEQIKKIYEALVNHLQIPSYTGEYLRYPFKIETFAKTFSFSINTVLYSLKALEQDGWLEFNEKDFSPSTVMVNASKKNLEEFYRHHNQYESLITTLLRAYGGILDYPAFISETLLARLMNQTDSGIKKSLQEIAAHGIISYSPQNEAPMITLLKHRVPVDEFQFRSAVYFKRKELFIERANKMISFVQTLECRSRFINEYFGDLQAKDCGICDNCLAKKSRPLDGEDLNRIIHRIKSLLASTDLTMANLLAGLNGVNSDQAWKALDLLQAEDKIHVGQDGKLKWKN